MSDTERKEITETVEAITQLDDGAKQFILGYAAGVVAATREQKAS